MNRENRNVFDQPNSASGGKLTLRWRLLLSVNATLAVLLTAFLFYEYHRSLNTRLAEKHASLQEEAGAVAEGVTALRHHGRNANQDYIDAFCRRMQEASSPGHHLVVESDGSTFQAHAHQRASAEIVTAVRSADDSPGHRVPFGNQELIVGSGRQDNVRVYVSEYVGDIRRSVFADMVRHLLALGLGGLVAAIIVNLVLDRVRSTGHFADS